MPILRIIWITKSHGMLLRVPIAAATHYMRIQPRSLISNATLSSSYRTRFRRQVRTQVRRLRSEGSVITSTTWPSGLESGHLRGEPRQGFHVYSLANGGSELRQEFHINRWP